MGRIPLHATKDEYVEAGNIVDIGPRHTDPRASSPSIRDIKLEAREGAFTAKAKVFTDLSDENQAEEYNTILSDEENYYIASEDGSWAEEIDADGSKSRTYKVFLKYYEFNQEIYDKNLRILLEYHGLEPEEEVEETDSDLNVEFQKKEETPEAEEKPKKTVTKKVQVNSIDV